MGGDVVNNHEITQQIEFNFLFDLIRRNDGVSMQHYYMFEKFQNVIDSALKQNCNFSIPFHEPLSGMCKVKCVPVKIKVKIN